MIITTGAGLPVEAQIMLPGGEMIEVMWSEERERSRRAYLVALQADVDRTLEMFRPPVTHVRPIPDDPQA